MRTLIPLITILILFPAVQVAGTSDGNMRPDQTQCTTTQLDSFIVATMDAYHVPGLSACAVKADEVIWTGTYRYADVQQQIEVSDSTLFMIGSISKPITGYAFMQLYERGFISLDDDINDYLPFEVIHPVHPDAVITPRMLLSHVSGIRDNWNVLGPLECQGDSPIPLSEFTEGYLTTGGTYYRVNNFNESEPGTRFEYTNFGSTLIAYLVEVIAGMPFEQYCQEHLFTPLDMNETSWFLANLNNTHIAIPYTYSGSRFVPRQHYGSPVYPCGFLRTSAVQLSRFLSTIMGSGLYNGDRILESSTVESILSAHYPAFASNWGLFWINDGALWGHDGGGPGVATKMYFHPIVGIGVIVLLNIEDYQALNIMFDEIMDFFITEYGDNDDDDVLTQDDNCPEVYNPAQEDVDGDGIGDVCDTCPEIHNPDQEDSDADDVGDVCDDCTDTDGDGFGDPGYEANTCHEDKCPDVYNPDQAHVETSDINCDGSIDVLDILAVVNHILATAPIIGAPLDRGDCNGDGGVNVLDALSIVNIILGIIPECPGAEERRSEERNWNQNGALKHAP